MFQLLADKWGPLEIDLFHLITPNLSAQAVGQLEARTTSNALRCLLSQLAGHSGVCLPPIFSDRVLSSADSEPEGDRTDSGRSSLALTTVAPTASSVMHRPSLSDFHVSNTSNEGQST